MVGIGAALLASYAVRQLIPAAPPASAAARATTDAVNLLVVRLAAAEGALGHCPTVSSAAGLACATGSDQRMAADLDAFVRQLTGLRVPPTARDARARVVAVAQGLATDLHALAAAPDAPRYLAVATARHVRPLGAQLDHAAQLLLQRVGS